MDTNLTTKAERDLVLVKAIRNAHKPLASALHAIRGIREAERRTGIDLSSEELDGIERWFELVDERGLLQMAAVNPPE